MNKLCQTFILLFVFSILSAQDVIYTISGDYNVGKTPLDSIVIDNITNGTSISFTDLPEHDFYQINLTKNSFWGTVSAFDIKESHIFKELINTPGFLSVSYGGNSPGNAKVSVINSNGQVLYRKDNLTLIPNQALQVNVGPAGMYFVKVELPQQTKTFKIVGNSKQSGYDVRINDGADIKSNISVTVKSSTIFGEGDFTFEENDSIRIWAFRKDIYALPKYFRIQESKGIDFKFENINYSKRIEEAYPDSTGKVVRFAWGEDSLYCVKINGEYIYQGDIILTEDHLRLDLLKGASKQGINLWPDAKVYYTVSDELKDDERIKQAITYWNINSPVTFFERSNEKNYVEFVKNSNDDSGSSFLGMIKIIGRQPIKIGNNFTYGEIMHEMGHAVGLIHEHSRSDRDDSVKIIIKNVELLKRHNFEKVTSSINKGNFDFNSLMLYSSTDFAKEDYHPTITRLDGTTFRGQRSYLSICDIRILEELYGQNATKRPKVSLKSQYSDSDYSFTVTGKIEDEGDSFVTVCAITYKKLGDTNFNHEYFTPVNNEFSITINEKECSEYIFYASATNSFGTATSEIKSYIISPYFYVEFSDLTSSSAKLTAHVPSLTNVTGFQFRVGTGNNLLTFKSEHEINFAEAKNKYETVVTGLEKGKLYSFNGRIFYTWLEQEKSYFKDLSQFTTLEDQGPVYGQLTDTRGGETKTYKTVIIGEQEWMAENLAYLPSVSPSSQGSKAAPHYYVYGYQGTSVSAAKATYNYNTYGVLYNWPAAMAGGASSSANPSGVQGICPTGWHLPSDVEWTQLENYLVANGYNFDGTTNDNSIAKSMAASKLWNSSTLIGAIGNNLSLNNKSGFSAFPGGFSYHGDDLFDEIGYAGFWWSSTEYFFYDDIYIRYLDNNFPHSYSAILYKGYGHSVRCVRD